MSEENKKKKGKASEKVENKAVSKEINNDAEKEVNSAASVSDESAEIKEADSNEKDMNSTQEEKVSVDKDTVEQNDSKDNTSDEDGSQGGEDLSDSEIIDLNSPDSEKKLEDLAKNKSQEEDRPSKKNEEKEKKIQNKSSVEYLLSKKKKKKIRNWIITIVLLIVVGCFCLFLKNKADQAKMMEEAFSNSNIETAVVEKKTLNKTVSATGQLLSTDARTITRNLGSVADILEVKCKVGDYVKQGAELVVFSTENVDKSISQTKEDITNQKQQDAITQEDAERNYLNSYKSVANSIQDAAERVDKMLESLHEACNAYGDAKRELQKAKDEGKDQATISSLERTVDSAYSQQKSAQQNYDDAVEAQAKAISEGQSTSLSNADSTYKKSQITANNQVKQLQRTLEKYEDSLDDYVVRATISGVVTAVNVSEGNSFSAGSVLTIQDLSMFEAEVLVDEYDIPSVKSAYTQANDRGEDLEVVIKTEATDNKEYKGHVVSIDPTSTSTATYTTSVSTTTNSSGSTITATSTTSSTPQYKVKVLIDETDQAFMMGMTAKVAIIVEQSPKSSLCIPYNAIQETEDGEFYVQVVDNTDVINKNKDGIVVTNENAPGGDKSGFPGASGKGSSGFSGAPGSKSGFLSGLFSGSSSEEMKKMLENSKPKTHDVKVKKIFDTDYYTAVTPVNPGELNDGDTVVVTSNDDDKKGGNMMGMMMGGPGR